MRRRVNLPLYGLLVVLVASLLSPFASVFVSVQMSDTATDRALRAREVEQARVEEKQREAAKVAAENARERTCDLFRVFIAPFEEQPPDTKSGKELNQQLLTEYRRLRCVPPK